MSEFRGFLLRGDKTNTLFPHQYINLESWNATPKQREEIKAYRDDNTRDLTRITAIGRKSKFTFNTRPNLHLADREAIKKWLDDNISDADQRKIRVTYWDDENCKYDGGEFYIPDITYTIKQISKDDIIYNEMKFTFIEY